MVGIVETMEEFEHWADEILSPVMRGLGALPLPATSKPHFRSTLMFEKSYALGAASFCLSYDNSDYFTELEFRRTATADPVSFDGWAYDRDEIERSLKVRLSDKYLPMVLRTHAELLNRLGAQFLAEQSSASTEA